MGVQTVWNGEAIIADVIGRAPDIQLGADQDDWRLCRWRQFVGSYALPPLPDPIFVVHIAGKPSVKTWQRDGWSETHSFPGCATIVPAGMPTGWLVDGELDVVTLSIGSADVRRTPAADRFDLSRESVPHIGFGTGQHVCVGWRLAELQLRVVFRQLAGRVKRIEQIGQPRRFRSNFINGLKNLDLRLVPA